MKIEVIASELTELVDHMSLKAQMSSSASPPSPSATETYSPFRLQRPAAAFGYFGKGNKIEAIKIIREVYGVGLKEAKDIVEGTYT